MLSVKYRRKNYLDVKSTSDAAWWIKNPSKSILRKTESRKNSLGVSFWEDFQELLRNVSMHGYNKLMDPILLLWEKFIWFALHATTLIGVIIVLSLTWEQFAARYFRINLHDPVYPIEKVPFPAVSICSNNRISRRAAETYANELILRDPANNSMEYYLKNILYFRNMYQFYNYEVNDDYAAYSAFQYFLDRFGTDNDETFFNTRRQLRRLTPNCTDFLKACMLGGDKIECFTKQAFQESLTAYGLCCTFNLEDSYRDRSYKYRFYNSELGLTVILNGSDRDNFAPILNIDGYIVIIHRPAIFPDISSGGSQEVFPTHREESFVSIRARLIDTDQELRSYSTQTRKCYFHNEAPNPDLLIKKTYSFNNCITRCRIRSIIALCNCLPFYLPIDLVESARFAYCTLEHISCLLRYNYKWRNVLSDRRVVGGLEREMEDALYCPECQPSCDDVQYHVSLMALPIARYKLSLKPDQLKESPFLSSDDISVLRIHFATPHAQYYRRVIGNTWFEAFSTIGNIFSIFLGCSMVVIFEVTFLILTYIIRSVRNLWIQNKKKDNANNESDSVTRNEFYICP